jgi:iron-sulfur cluster repair protein YtfE (RIC family)
MSFIHIEDNYTPAKLDLATTPILELVSAYPELKQLLDNYGLDTCCGAHMSVTEAAVQDGIDPAPVLEALRQASVTRS